LKAPLLEERAVLLAVLLLEVQAVVEVMPVPMVLWEGTALALELRWVLFEPQVCQRQLGPVVWVSDSKDL